MTTKIIRATLLSVLLLPVWGHAAGAIAPQKSTVSKPRTMSLDRYRGKDETANSIALAKQQKSYPLRSDRDRLHSGGMRIDRAHFNPSKPVTPAAVPTTNMASTTAHPDADQLAPESEAIVGLNESADPVLSLFDSGGELASFRDAMGGAIGAIRSHVVWPVPLSAKQELSSGYGIRKDPFHGRPAFHGGIDIAAATGTPVLATANGIVTEVKNDVNYGKYITVQHADGALSRYGHLSGQNVTVGEQVRAGQTIGAVGTSGRSTGPHLDYRISKDGTKFDPLSVLSVPHTVAMAKGISPMHEAAAAVSKKNSATRIASNAIPRGPMVIKVR